MTRNCELRARIDAGRQLAARRVEAVWTCLRVLCPDLALEAKKELARKVLDPVVKRIRHRRSLQAL